jgi:hypothetical protein
MTRRHHRRRKALVKTIVLTLVVIKLVLVNVNLITQNQLNISHKLARHGVDTTTSKLETMTAVTVHCVWASFLQSPSHEKFPDLETRGH